MAKLTVVKIGDELGVVLTRKALAILPVKEGDVLFLRPTVRGVEIYAYENELGEEVPIARLIAERRALAKF